MTERQKKGYFYFQVGSLAVNASLMAAVIFWVFQSIGVS